MRSMKAWEFEMRKEELKSQERVSIAVKQRLIKVEDGKLLMQLLSTYTPTITETARERLGV
ncbi:hypothetical protein CDL15_Pgr007951 [Punica granatum]|uniref:Uncharacterized protein n=1 Tax=Punica granatum TaxID=22663 RepID=A0A218XC29_PUNGR|nr:hypothetical protein CDL15_Pgr007951 [Punica granatum]